MVRWWPGQAKKLAQLTFTNTFHHFFPLFDCLCGSKWLQECEVLSGWMGFLIGNTAAKRERDLKRKLRTCCGLTPEAYLKAESIIRDDNDGNAGFAQAFWHSFLNSHVRLVVLLRWFWINLDQLGWSLPRCLRCQRAFLKAFDCPDHKNNSVPASDSKSAGTWNAFEKWNMAPVFKLLELLW